MARWGAPSTAVARLGLIKVGGDLGGRLESDAGITAVMVSGTIRGPIVSAGQIEKIDARGGAEMQELRTTTGGLGELNVRGSLSVNTFNIQGALGRLKAGAL